MRFKVSTMNDLAICHQKTVIVNKEKEEKTNFMALNPKLCYLNLTGYINNFL